VKFNTVKLMTHTVRNFIDKLNALFKQPQTTILAVQFTHLEISIQ